MNIALLASTSSYHHLARLLEKESSTVYHYGASRELKPYGTYHPIHMWLSLKDPLDEKMKLFLEDSKDKKIDFVMAAGLTISKMDAVHKELTERKVPYFFVNSKLADLERDKSITKQLLAKLGIPTPKFQKADGKYLYENFFKIPRPFVVKLNYVYMYGKQTIIVNDDNFKEVYEDLFSLYTSGDYRLNNIQKDTRLLIEEFVELKREYSYHALFNKVNWQYFGSARDYKPLYENDKGPNSVSLGSYSLVDVDPVVHEYAEKIYNFLKEFMKDDYYKGFIFLGIGVNKDNVPMILEINTRSGDPELPAILGSVDNNLSELLHAASTDTKIPEVKHNKKETVVVRVINRVYDWNTPASFLPKFEPPPKNIIHSIDSGPQPPETPDVEYKGIKHSIFTSTAANRKTAAKRIYEYLDKQYLGQYTYRRDIGLLE
jgi:phosphoribosylamine--glycine ligase